MSNRPNPKNRTSSSVSRRPSAAPEPPSRLPWIIGGVVLVVLVIAGIAVFATRKSSDSATSVPSGGTVVPVADLVYGTVSINGAALPQKPDSGADPAVGMKAPVVTGQQFNGSTLTFPATGKPAVVMFVAHWCPHCQNEVPKIASYLASAGLPTDVDLYSVATATAEDRPNYPPSKWLNKEKWAVPTVADNQKGEIAQAYGLTSYPYFVVVDAQGNVVTRTSGELEISAFQDLLTQAKASGTTGTAKP